MDALSQNYFGKSLALVTQPSGVESVEDSDDEEDELITDQKNAAQSSSASIPVFSNVEEEEHHIGFTAVTDVDPTLDSTSDKIIYFDYDDSNCFDGSLSFDDTGTEFEAEPDEGMSHKLISNEDSNEKQLNAKLMETIRVMTDEETNHAKIIDSLLDQIKKMEVLLTKKDFEIDRLQKLINKAIETFSRMNRGKMSLDEILSQEVYFKRGLGYTFDYTSDEKPVMSTVMSRNISVVCDFCLKPGHIKPYCWKLKKELSEISMLSEIRSNISFNIEKSVTLDDDNLTYALDDIINLPADSSLLHCKVVFTSLKANICGSWYFL